MRVFYGIGQLGRTRPKLKDVVAAIGVFDGVHLGHQEVIRRAVSEARRIGGTSMVVTFHPHPVAVLHPERFSSYITTLSQRLKIISELGVDACLVVSFNKRFSALRPVDFVERYLVRGLKVKKIVVGDDFHFGHDRVGTIKLLKAQGVKSGFVLEAKSIKKINNTYIKSSYIREQLAKGCVEGLERLLGRPYSVIGRVVHGDGRGRKLGFPTANLQQENVVILPAGIYIARVTVDGKQLNALFYIGRRPSFKGARARLVLEVYIFDFKGGLYGRMINVDVLKRLRSDMRFPDGESLVEQIGKDVAAAREYFSALK
ncbi:MAG: bifunctional riboflavin kinase/FAD synthetase [Candidatus Omnitrophica bacterium]|nr:bifunctional riboflavin kinase/FAD synthetase [Candidatus Omnitrophota bacterium]